MPVYLFTGNHDMWMFDYFTNELNIPVYRKPLELKVGNTFMQVGHGDGLGPGDNGYKFIKKIFSNQICQWMFAALPARLGMGIAMKWSRHSRINNSSDEVFLGEKEFLLSYCRDIEKIYHHDFYIFGHRHLPLDLSVGPSSRYINLGEWINHCTFAVFNGATIELKEFKG